MATPSTTPFNLTGDALVDATTHGYYWQLGADRTVRWSLSSGFNGEFWNYPTETAQLLSSVFSTYSYYSNIKFTYSGHFASPTAAASFSDINISLDGSNYIFNDIRTWAVGAFPSSGNDAYYAGAPGDIFINLRSQANYLSSYAPGSAGYFLAIHEIGHALGLKHPHDDGGTGRPTLASLGAQMLDEDWFSVMSYSDDFNWNLREWDPATPMLADVLAMQYLYGPNMQTNVGNSTYALPINSFYATVWDAGGIDEINVSASTAGWVIALPDTQVSTLVSTKAGLAALVSETALASPHTFYWLTGDIENAIGSVYVDVIQGSSLNNVLKGGGGSDAIDGRGGMDTALYSGARGNFTITKTAAGYSIKDNIGFEGLDTLASIERVEFSDRSVAFDIDGNAGKAYRLYQAAFDRKPDLGGLGVWINQLDHGQSLEWVSAQFQTSQEFQLKYGANVLTAQFVTLLYQNVLHRAPDGGGLSAWSGALDAHAQTRPQVLAGFSESPENQAALIGVIQNGMEYIQVA